MYLLKIVNVTNIETWRKENLIKDLVIQQLFCCNLVTKTDFLGFIRLPLYDYMQLIFKRTIAQEAQSKENSIYGLKTHGRL